LGSEAESFKVLRDFVGLPPGRIWLDDQFPLVHGPDPSLALSPPVTDLPDIVVILIESLRAECFDFFYPDTEGCEVSYLGSMARKGIVFPRFIANGFPSSEGLVAVAASSWPHHRKRIIVDYTDVQFDLLPLRMASMGYYTLAAEPNAGFDRVGLWYDQYFQDRIDLHDMGIAATEAALVEAVKEKVAQHDRESPDQPLYLHIKTTNPHLPYGTPDESGRSYYIDGETLLDHYRHTMIYIDAQFESLLTWMESRPRGENTVIVVIGDHANYLDQKNTTGLPLNETAWVGAWIYGPKRWVGEARRIDENFSQVDLAATLMAMVGDTRPTASIGRDMLSSEPGREGIAVMVRPGGFRMDRKDRSAIIDRKRTGSFSAYDAFPKEPGDGPDQTSFDEEDLDRLWDSIMTVSFLIEQDRVWDPNFLDGSLPDTR
jgi:phosphoglycerol transferase MdoB-like AlkP superfamily enzyme